VVGPDHGHGHSQGHGQGQSQGHALGDGCSTLLSIYIEVQKLLAQSLKWYQEAMNHTKAKVKILCKKMW